MKALVALLGLVTASLQSGTPPIAAFCKDSHVKGPEDFKPVHQKVYKYEVLGGLHGVTARQELLEEYPDIESFNNVSAIIYCGLTDVECLRLAYRHNINGHFTHEMTHRDYLEACQARLYEMAGLELNKNATPPCSTEWKKQCQLYILPPDMPKTTRENILNQASFSLGTWILATQVMDAYEAGNGQGKHTKGIVTIKQHHLQPLHHLNEEFQMDMLQNLLDHQITFGELREKAMQFRALEAVKSAFVRTTNSNNWETARELFPHHANVDRLKPFTNLSFKGGLPGVFKDYCRSAMLSTESTPMDTSTITTFSKDGCSLTFLKVDSTVQTGEYIKRHLPDFCGANLMIAVITKEMTTEQITSLAYTAREINRTWTHLSTFNFVILSELEDKEKVESCLSCYDSVEHAYGYNSQATGRLATNLSVGRTMTQALKLVTVAHWSENGQLSAQHIRGEGSNVLEHANDDELLLKIVDRFSFQGNMVINMSGDATHGRFAAACLKGGRNGIVFYTDPDVGATATGSLADYLLVEEDEGQDEE